MTTEGRTGKVLARAMTLMVLGFSLACARKTPPLEFAYDRNASFEGFESYAWFDDPKRAIPEGNSIVDGPFIDRTIREAVDQSLSKKGFEKVTKDPSFYVAYREGAAGSLSQDKWDLRTQKPAACPPECNLFSFGPRDLDLSPDAVGDVGSRYRKKVTVAVTIRDSGERVIWYGARTTGIGTNPREVSRDLREAVASLLSRFPPKTRLTK